MPISQEEIVTNAQTVTKGLEALRLEHQSILGGLKVGDNATNKDTANGGPGKEHEALIEKASLLEVRRVKNTQNLSFVSSKNLLVKSFKFCNLKSNILYFSALWK